MKIQLASTLPFSPVQLDPRHASPRRSVGLLSGVHEGMHFSSPVYEFRHGDNDTVSYKVAPSECIWSDQAAEAATYFDDDAEEFVWLEHNDGHTYKPYAFLVMDAMTKLLGQWDGVVYRTPSGERLRESAFAANLQVVDACVSQENGLWVMVSLTGESATLSGRNVQAVRQLGWVPVAC